MSNLGGIMDSFNNPVASITKNETKEKVVEEKKENVEFTLQKEFEKVLGGTLEGAFELKGGMGLLVTIRKDDKPYALVVQRPSNGAEPKDKTDVYITPGIGK
jgi:hypothetical protein